MRRWLVLTLGLGIALLAGYALLSQTGGGRGTTRPGAGDADEIDPASRARLERILREADQENGRSR